MDFRFTVQDASPRALAGVDVGGTKVAVLLADVSGRMLGRTVVPTALDSAERTLSTIADAVHRCAQAVGVEMRDLAAVGIGVPGRVDTRTGVVQQAVNLGWQEVPAGARLSSLLGVPCVLENDVRLAAVGLQRRASHTANAGPTGHAESIAYVSVGTGIAAGLIIHGRLYRGAHGMAGEIGHSILDLDGPLCVCGARGCLEALAAGPAIARLAKEAVASGVHTSLRPGAISAEEVYSAAGNADPVALSITHRVGRYLAQAIQQLIMLYDVERVVLGGGVSRAGAAFLNPILNTLENLRAQSELAREMIRPGMITLLDPEYDAGAWGALALANDFMSREQQYEP
ncbi:MAG: ROK family protein [Chloroflexia bacterium]